MTKQSSDNKDNREPYQHTPFLDAADLRWNDDLPTSTDYDDRYFSVDDGLQESQYVFIEGANVLEQWRAAHRRKQSDTGIMELGFGSGLNFLATLDSWIHWRKHEASNACLCLRYFAIEKHPMKRSDLKRTLLRWRRQLPFYDSLIDQFPPRIRGQHRLSFCGGQVELILLFDDVRTAFAQLVATEPFIDAVYMDGFAPSRNPAMWSFGVLQRIAELSRPQATLATFSAAGELRRGLERVGYSVTKRRGFARKREMLVATHVSQPAFRLLRDRQPWFALPHVQRPRRVAIIGAGLAGSTSARALAERNIACTVFDAGHAAASKASAVPVAGWFPQLSLNFDRRSEIHWQACRLLEDYLRRTDSGDQSSTGWFDSRGCFFIADSAEREQRLQRIAQRLGEVGLPVSFVQPSDSRATTGLELSHPGLDCDLGGSLIPARLCAEQMQHDLIETRYAHRVVPHRNADGDWQIHHDGGIEGGFDAVVLATGADTSLADTFLDMQYDLTRGHVSLINDEALSGLKRLLCFKGHLTGGLGNDGSHVTGATMIRDEHGDVAENTERDPNVDRLRNILGVADPEESLNSDHAITSHGIWQGERLASRDRLPLVGSVPTRQSIHNVLSVAQLSNSMRSFPALEFEPGLFVNLAHGGRGATTALLSARLLAEMISAQPLSLPRRLVDALHVGRFQIRDELMATSSESR